MNGLRELAVAELEAEKCFIDTVHQFPFIHVQLQNEQSPITQARDIAKNEIVSKMAARASTAEIFDSLQVERYILHLILRNSYGFHQFPATSPPTNGQVIISYFISTFMYMLAWSFNPATMETKAILMTREANSMVPERKVERCFRSILFVYANHIYSPTFLKWKPTLGMAIYIVPIGNEPNMSAITQLSKSTGRTLTVLANLHRHQLISRAILSHISKTVDAEQSANLPLSSRTPLHAKHSDSLMDVVSTLDTQIIWNESYVAYQKAKSRWSTHTHEDAAQSITLANTSAKIAEEAKNDSYAMKTIATMTMLFLPGTFLAAFFALPSLKWDECKCHPK
ncbi:hypothetical protein DM02DRAFT_663349 [Periconia macrospinosa]|uniref:Uncharacterized protein n=1 Tax=Periconia macrospinosa TaxID=97972 RepID=A0A2V1D1Y1_9PLEO|nr:hypothetical protein DM02DRAFT_663349 [Periconia macrospinosa]